MSASTASADPSDADRVRRRTIWFYAAPGLVTAIPSIPVFTLVPVYYADDLALGLVLTGLALLIGRSIDVFTDPLVGRWADRYGPRGLTRLVLLGACIAGPALYAVLSPPEQAGFSWLLISSTLLFFGWTLVQIPYLTWGATLSPDYHQRTRLSAGRETAILFGIMLSGSLPALLGHWGLTQAQSLSGVAVFAIVLGIPAFYLLLRRTPLPKPHTPAPMSWRGITQNRLFLRLLTAWFINSLANGIPAILFGFYCSQILLVDDQSRNLLLSLYFISAVLGMPIWLWAGKRFSKMRVWSSAMLISVPAFALATQLGPGQVEMFAVICLITGLCLGADLALPPAIQADVADWDRLRFRRNRTAGLFSLWNMSAKLALAAAAGFSLPLLGALGLDQATPTPLALTALAVIYALVPCVIKLSAVALVFNLPLTPEKHSLIRRRLQRRDEAYQRTC